MLNRPVLFLWLSFEIRRRKQIGFGFPLPLFSFYMLFDMVDDLMSFINLLSFNRLSRAVWGRYPYGSTLLAVKTGETFMRELILSAGPMDLVDIDMGDGHGGFKIFIRLV
jgi:hypothetical protein